MGATSEARSASAAFQPSAQRGGWLIILLLAALLLRLTFVLAWPGSVQWTDATGYHRLAHSILHDGTFPSAYRSPGYPAFIAALYGLFGESQLPVLVAQAIVGTLGVGAAYLLGVEIVGRRRRGVAIAAAALYGLSPGVAYFVSWMWREAWLTFLVPLCLWLCFRMLKRTWRYALPLGLSLAAAAYVRMDTLLPVAVLLALALLRRTWRWRALGGGAVAAGIVAAATAPWIHHCAATRGYASMDLGLPPSLFARTWYLAPDGAVEPEFRAYARAVMDRHRLSDHDRRGWKSAMVLVLDLPKGDVVAEAALYRKMGRVAWENIRRQPYAYLASFPFNLWVIVGGEPFSWLRDTWLPSWRECLRDHRWGILALKFFHYVIWPLVVIPLALVGLGWTRRSRDSAAPCLTAAYVALAVFLVGLTALASDTSPRYRVPYDPILYLGAVLGAAALLRKGRPLPADRDE